MGRLRGVGAQILKVSVPELAPGGGQLACAVDIIVHHRDQRDERFARMPPLPARFRVAVPLQRSMCSALSLLVRPLPAPSTRRSPVILFCLDAGGVGSTQAPIHNPDLGGLNATLRMAPRRFEHGTLVCRVHSRDRRIDSSRRTSRKEDDDRSRLRR